MLTPLDDYLCHQTPYPIDTVFTSDRNFYDRYYFNCHDIDGNVFLVLGMGLYPNIGVIDAFATCSYKGYQYNVRASRELNFDRLNTTVGPISVQVLEGLRRLRMSCEKNDWGLDFDLTFEGTTFPTEEPHFFRRANSRAVMDYTRLTQVGRWSGELSVAGDRFTVEPSTWWGGRDRSWGVRPVGGPEPPSAPARDGLASFHWQWAVFQFEDEAIYYTTTEDHTGTPWHCTVARAKTFPSQEHRRLALVKHDIRLLPGTRTFHGATITVRDGDQDIAIECEPLNTLYMAGAGYGGAWRHGMYHGPLAVEGDRWDLSDPNTLAMIKGQNETVCNYRMGDKLGHGIFELLVIGPYQPWGLTSLFDVP